MLIHYSDTLWQRRPLGADGRMRRWLLDQGSLTRRIQLRSRHFRVVLRALKQVPDAVEELLGQH